MFVYINNSNDTKRVPWSRYSEISAGLGEGRDVISGKAVNMNDMSVEPISALVVEFTR